MGMGIGLGWGWDGNGDRSGVGLGMGWEWGGDGSGDRTGVQLGPWLGPPALWGSPTGFCVPAAEGPERGVSPARTRGGEGSRRSPQLPAAPRRRCQLRFQRAGGVGGGFSSIPPPRHWGCPRCGACLGEGGSFSSPAPQSGEPGAAFCALLLKLETGRMSRGAATVHMGPMGGGAPGTLHGPPPPQLGHDPHERPRHEGLAGMKCSPCNGLRKYLLEYFIISEGGKLSPA